MLISQFLYVALLWCYFISYKYFYYDYVKYEK